MPPVRAGRGAGPPGGGARRRSWQQSLDAQLVREGAQPAAGGGQDDVTDLEAAELARDMGPIAGGGLGEPGAKRRGARIDADLAAGLGVDEGEVADVRQLVLARIADLDDE